MSNRENGKSHLKKGKVYPQKMRLNEGNIQESPSPTRKSKNNHIVKDRDVESALVGSDQFTSNTIGKTALGI